ncbi:hypothetical protein [Ruminococcus sp. YE282]|uniref:hypothetical protein n=1 Tax=Ruminococcus sp. YE282 TaxID=3158780 RepID=UPI000881FDF8|nr:hypothetical protein SAMN02910441_00172 [Ruminococcus bromii]
MLVSVYDICCIVEREDKQIIRLTREDTGRKCFVGAATEVKKSKYSDYRVSKIRADGDKLCIKIYKL